MYFFLITPLNLKWFSAHSQELRPQIHAVWIGARTPPRVSHSVLWVISQTSEGREAPAEDCKTSDERLVGNSEGRLFTTSVWVSRPCKMIAVKCCQIIWRAIFFSGSFSIFLVVVERGKKLLTIPSRLRAVIACKNPAALSVGRAAAWNGND